MNRSRVWALFTASLLYFASLYVYVPTLPAYIAERTTTLTAVGVVLSMYGLWMAVLRLPLGVITDATSRNKPSIVAGILMAGAGAVMMAIGRSAGPLAFGRALTGASAAVWVPLTLLVVGGTVATCALVPLVMGRPQAPVTADTETASKLT